MPLDAPPIDPVVLIQVGDGTCAGVIVDDAGNVATAYHCVALGLRPAITTRDGALTHGRVTRVSVADDLALIAADDLAGRPALPVGDPPAVGETVWAVGHPYGGAVGGGFFAGTLRWAVMAGEVSAVGERAIQLAMPLQPGNSGGPIIDGDGRVVGIVSRRIGAGGPGFAARGDTLRALIAGERGRAPGLGGTFEASVAVSILGATPSYGVAAHLVVRDRIVFTASGAAAVGARWDAVRDGTVAWDAAELRLGLRQRIGRGGAALRLDAWGGLVTTMSWTSPDDDPLRLRTGGEAALAFGAGVWSQRFGLDVGAVATDAGWVSRIAIGARWPGMLGIF